MKRFIWMAALLTQGLYAYTQNTLTGTVTGADDHRPVPYVSIGVTRTPNGTVANAAGVFSITLDSKVTDNDTLKFSSIGYQSEGFLIGELKERLKHDPLTISLHRLVNQLRQVSVTSKKGHVKIVGYDKNSKLFGLGFYASGVGSQGGVIIPISHPETNLENVSFYIVDNPFKHLLFRVNLYELVNNKPGNNILTENIFLHVDDKQTGKMIFDLSKYNLYFGKDVLLTLEWIDAQPSAPGTRLVVAAAVFGHTWYQQASQSAWTKKGTGLGLSVKTVY